MVCSIFSDFTNLNELWYSCNAGYNTMVMLQRGNIPTESPPVIPLFSWCLVFNSLLWPWLHTATYFQETVIYRDASYLKHELSQWKQSTLCLHWHAQKRIPIFLSPSTVRQPNNIIVKQIGKCSGVHASTLQWISRLRKKAWQWNDVCLK